MTTYTDELFCDHCQRDTEHIVQDDDHERDSSNYIETCTVCRWYRSGYDGKYHAPLFEYTESQSSTIHPIQNMPDDELIDLIKFIGTLHQDGHRSYKSMAEEVRKYVSESF